MKIALFTATWHYNLWDELILKQEYEYLKNRYSNPEFFIFTYNKESSLLPVDEKIEYISYFPKNIKKRPFLNLKYLFSNITAILKSDLIIIGGWWLIYEKEVQKSSSPVWQWKLRVFFAKLFFKKIIWLAVGISYSKEKMNDLKYLFNWKNVFVSVRDIKSQNLLDSINIQSSVLPDPVFSYENSKKLNDKSKLIWISLRYKYLKDEENNIKQIILYLSKKWYDITFISHSIHEEDRLANDYLLLRDFAKKYNLWITRTIKDTLSTYPNLKFVIWMRLHSLVLSTIFDIPFLALNYWVKTDELLKNLEYDYNIPSKVFDFSDFIKKFDKLEVEQNSVKLALKSKYDKIKESLVLDYNNFFDGLEKS